MSTNNPHADLDHLLQRLNLLAAERFDVELAKRGDIEAINRIADRALLAEADSFEQIASFAGEIAEVLAEAFVALVTAVAAALADGEHR